MKIYFAAVFTLITLAQKVETKTPWKVILKPLEERWKIRWEEKTQPINFKKDERKCSWIDDCNFNVNGTLICKKKCIKFDLVREISYRRCLPPENLISCKTFCYRTRCHILCKTVIYNSCES